MSGEALPRQAQGGTGQGVAFSKGHLVVELPSRYHFRASAQRV